jgi:hypothetical protein
MAYIPLKTVIEKSPFSKLKLDVVASDPSEIQIQFEYGWTDEFFDLSVEEATKLRDTLTEFIGDGGEANEA